MVALADWSQRIFPTNLFFQLKTLSGVYGVRWILLSNALPPASESFDFSQKSVTSTT
jgi:hypothetical protein